MKNKLLTEQFVNPFFIQGEKLLLDNIIIFKDGNVITELKQGWFERPNSNSFKEVVFNEEIKKRKKVNLNNKEIFFVKPNILYINQDFLKNFNLENNVNIYENDLEINYGDRVSFEVFGTFKKFVNDNGTIIPKYVTDWKKVSVTNYVKTELTEHGKYIKELSDKAKENGIDISLSNMNKLNKIFDIKIK